MLWSLEDDESQRKDLLWLNRWVSLYPPAVLGIAIAVALIAFRRRLADWAVSRGFENPFGGNPREVFRRAYLMMGLVVLLGASISLYAHR